MASTTIVIPGRTTQTIPGMTMTKDDVVNSYAGQVDLSGYAHNTETDGENVTITFSTKTGTKGSVVINGGVNTVIIIPGREASTIPGMALSKDEVLASYAGSGTDLSQYDSTVNTEGDTTTITFSVKTGTKGVQGLATLIAAALAAEEGPVVAEEGPVVAEAGPTTEEEEEVPSTKIIIPGREAQVIEGLVMDKDAVVSSYSGRIDLSGFDVTEEFEGSQKVITFSTKTGTKG